MKKEIIEKLVRSLKKELSPRVRKWSKVPGLKKIIIKSNNLSYSNNNCINRALKEKQY